METESFHIDLVLFGQHEYLIASHLMALITAQGCVVLPRFDCVQAYVIVLIVYYLKGSDLSLTTFSICRSDDLAYRSEIGQIVKWVLWSNVIQVPAE